MVLMILNPVPVNLKKIDMSKQQYIFQSRWIHVLWYEDDVRKSIFD